jgi:hypothetical protein
MICALEIRLVLSIAGDVAQVQLVFHGADDEVVDTVQYSSETARVLAKELLDGADACERLMAKMGSN